MSPLRIAFVGIGQNYPTHVWMRRMLDMLGEQVVVAIDDRRNTRRLSAEQRDAGRAPTRLVPRKMNRVMRMLKTLGITGQSHASVRDEWMLREIASRNATHVLVHFLDYAVQFASVWRRLDIPVVVHCHGYDITWDLRHFSKGTPVHPENYRDLVRSLPDNVWFIANSTSTRNKLLELGINPGKVFIKRFGVPTSSTPPRVDDKRRSNVLFLGRLVSFKGPVETVLAYQKIASRHPSCFLEIAGDGPLADEVDRAIAETASEPFVRRHGVVDLEAGEQLRERAAIFTAHNQTGVVTGQVEAFGVSLLEAMGVGVPVVTGRSGGIPDFVHHRSNGLLFESGDVDTHAKMLDELLSSPELRRELGLAAWTTVREKYQPQHELDDLLSILHRTGELVASPLLDQHNKAAA